MRFFFGFSIAMHCSTNVLKLMCFRFWPGTITASDDPFGVVRGFSLWTGVPDAMIRGGESRLKAPFVPQREICVSLLVCMRGGRLITPATPGPVNCFGGS